MTLAKVKVVSRLSIVIARRTERVSGRRSNPETRRYDGLDCFVIIFLAMAKWSDDMSSRLNTR